jgi:hypothetical protein
MEKRPKKSQSLCAIMRITVIPSPKMMEKTTSPRAAIANACKAFLSFWFKNIMPYLLKPYRRRNSLHNLCGAVPFDIEGLDDRTITFDMNFFTVDRRTISQKNNFESGLTEGTFQGL